MYEALNLGDEEAPAETPGPGVRSWRVRGISALLALAALLVLWRPGTSMQELGPLEAKFGVKHTPLCPTGGNNCPKEWNEPTHPGGYHCLYQLAHQASHSAYKKSGGACRPAEDGPFPAADCQAQCGMGQAAEGGAIAHAHGSFGSFHGFHHDFHHDFHHEVHHEVHHEFHHEAHYAHDAGLAEKTVVEGQEGDTIFGKDGTAIKGWKWDADLEKFVRTAAAPKAEEHFEHGEHGFSSQVHLPAEKTIVEGQEGDTVVGKDGTAMKGWKWDSHLEKFVRTEHHEHHEHHEALKHLASHFADHQVKLPADQSFAAGRGDTLMGQDGTAIKGWKWDAHLDKFVRAGDQELGRGSEFLAAHGPEEFHGEDMYGAAGSSVEGEVPAGWTYDAAHDKFIKVGTVDHVHHIHHIHHVPKETLHEVVIKHIQHAHKSAAPEEVTFHQPSASYDCSAGKQNWQAGWSSDKKAFCCHHSQVGCEEAADHYKYDCHVSDAHPVAEWSESQASWCCTHFSQGCTAETAPLYSCEGGQWEGWEKAKKHWCCYKEKVACDPFNCEEGEKDSWGSDKKDWCCEHGKKGCPFECGEGKDWTSWNDEKKEWCCDNQGLGCQDFHCTGDSWETWAQKKKSWCCDNFNRACDTYDCDYQKDDHMEKWSYSKRAYCCIKEEKGCAGAHDSHEFDCAHDFDDWQKKWSSDKKEWCCHTHLRGCTPHTTPAPYSCDNLEHGESWEDMWSKEKKDWCCTHLHKACDRFDCDYQLSGHKDLWTEEKQKWCCDEKEVGCVKFECGDEDPHGIPFSAEQKSWCCDHEKKHCAEKEEEEIKYDCDTQGGSWESWKVEERNWCCDHFSVGCEKFDCAHEYDDFQKAWEEEKKSFCCHKVGLGCPKEVETTTEALFDCETHKEAWEEHWTPMQRGYCCKYEGKACSPFDCSYKLSNSSSWSVTKQNWCCIEEQKGCPTTKAPEKSFDCDAGKSNWKKGWSAAKKSWCCNKIDCDSIVIHSGGDSSVSSSNAEGHMSDAEKEAVKKEAATLKHLEKKIEDEVAKDAEGHMSDAEKEAVKKEAATLKHLEKKIEEVKDGKKVFKQDAKEEAEAENAKPKDAEGHMSDAEKEAVKKEAATLKHLEKKIEDEVKDGKKVFKQDAKEEAEAENAKPKEEKTS